MIYGYARVSRDHQDLTLQLDRLRAAGCDKVFQETGGRLQERPQLRKVLDALTGEDTLVVVHTDRLGGGPRLFLEILDRVQTTKAGFRSLDEPQIDTTTPELAEIIFFFAGLFSRRELERIRSRTSAGREAAKARGVKFGRRNKLSSHQQREALARLAADEPQRAIAASYNVSQSTISRLRP